MDGGEGRYYWFLTANLLTIELRWWQPNLVKQSLPFKDQLKKHRQQLHFGWHTIHCIEQNIIIHTGAKNTPRRKISPEWASLIQEDPNTCYVFYHSRLHEERVLVVSTRSPTNIFVADVPIFLHHVFYLFQQEIMVHRPQLSILLALGLLKLRRARIGPIFESISSCNYYYQLNDNKFK